MAAVVLPPLLPSTTSWDGVLVSAMDGASLTQAISDLGDDRPIPGSLINRRARLLEVLSFYEARPARVRGVVPFTMDIVNSILAGTFVWNPEDWLLAGLGDDEEEEAAGEADLDGSNDESEEAPEDIDWVSRVQSLERENQRLRKRASKGKRSILLPSTGFLILPVFTSLYFLARPSLGYCGRLILSRNLVSPSLCAISALAAYASEATLVHAPVVSWPCLFPLIHDSKGVTTATRSARLFQAAFKAALVASRCFANDTLQGMRVAGAISASVDAAGLADVMRAGAWRSAATAARYSSLAAVLSSSTVLRFLNCVFGGTSLGIFFSLLWSAGSGGGYAFLARNGYFP
ncbi:hypothetical protein BC829DRAFT_443555 [Chytridium lagenaria]|nr:hypothetical protein BC829DRAFT_443555 [Chytridium lagenaria]